MDVTLTVLPKQDEVLRDVVSDGDGPAPFTVLYVGGVGSGKTWVGARWIVLLALRNPPACAYMATAPSYPQIVLYTLPAIEDALEQLHVPYTYNKQEKCFVLPGRRRIWVRSTDDPDKLVGGTVAGVWEDEAGQDSPDVMRRLIQRTREPRANLRQMLMTSTPEGTRTALYAEEQRAESGDPTVRLVRARTRENVHMPADYFAALERAYANDEAGRRQYLDGLATDASGNIYTNLRPENVVDAHRGWTSADIVLGWDFNVRWMVTTVAMWWGNRRSLHVYGEVVSQSANGTTTIEHARKVREYLMREGFAVEVEGRIIHSHSGERVVACIDASGANKHSSATQTDEAAVRGAGFLPRFNDANPLVRDRIAAVQLALANGALLLDGKRAPETLRALKEHARDKHGEPQKVFPHKDDFQADHYCDALGYTVWALMPVHASSHRGGMSHVQQLQQQRAIESSQRATIRSRIL